MRPEISSALLLRAMRMIHIAGRLPSGEFKLIEHCGILKGRGHRVTRLDVTANVSPDPERNFEIDPAALVAAHRAARRANALEVLGYFHTHPDGSAAPSIRDAECADPDGKLWLIVSTEGAALWRAVPNGAIHGRFDHVRFDIRTGARVDPDAPYVQWRGLALEHRVKMDLEVEGKI